jgi:hypothetical protein
LETLGVVTTADLEHYAYIYLRVLSEFYAVDGLE